MCCVHHLPCGRCWLVGQRSGFIISVSADKDHRILQHMWFLEEACDGFFFPLLSCCGVYRDSRRFTVGVVGGVRQEGVCALYPGSLRDEPPAAAASSHNRGADMGTIYSSYSDCPSFTCA